MTSRPDTGGGRGMSKTLIVVGDARMGLCLLTASTACSRM